MNNTNKLAAALVKVALPSAAVAGALVGAGLAVRSHSSASRRQAQIQPAPAPAPLVEGPSTDSLAHDDSPGAEAIQRTRLGTAQRLMAQVRAGHPSTSPSAPVPTQDEALPGRAGRASGDLGLFTAHSRRRGGLLGSLKVAAPGCNGLSCSSGPKAGNACNSPADCAPAPAPAPAPATPTVGTFAGPSSAYYKAAQNLDFTVSFSASVSVTGSPRVVLSVGGTPNYYANYQSGTGSSTLTFRYTPSAGANGTVSTSATLDLNGGTIKNGTSSSVANTGMTGTYSGLVIDTTVPAKASSGAITASDVDANGSYTVSDTVTLTFSEPVLVSNVTAANLSVSGKSLGSGAAVSAQSASGGYATSYVLTLGTGTSVASGETLTIAAANVVDRAGNAASAAVNFTLPTFNTAPTVTSVSLSGTATAGNALTGSYNYSDADSDAQNTSGSGTSYRWVRSTDNSVGSTGDNSNVASGFTLGGNQTYTLVTGDVGKYLFYCVTPVASAGITTGAEACSTASSQVVAPAATSISSINSPTNGYYKTGTTLTFTVNFGAAVTVTGSPRIAINLGGSTVYASYASGSGTSALTFSYTVQSGDTAASGISISSPVDLNSGTVQDAYSQAPTLTFTPPSLSGVLVDTTLPDKASNAAITANDVDATGSYTGGDTLTLTFSEPIATASIAVGNLSVASKSLGASPSLTPLSASNGLATSYRLTLGSGTTVANNDVLSITAANVVDQAGNAAASAVTFTVPTLNAAPVASALGITGTAQVGVQLTGTYSYNDAETNPQGASQYAWYSGANSNGSGKTAINQATSINYTPVAGDVGKYLFFCVTPVATAGTPTGVQVCSSASGAVIAAAINGQCGTVAATPFMPSGAGLCLTPGAASAVNVGSPWTWTCQGSNGGSSSPTCSAPNSSVTGNTTGRATQSVSNGWTIDTPNSAGFIPLTGHAKSPVVTPPAGYTFPQGLFDVSLTGPQGGSTTLVLTFSSPLPAGTVYMKYGKTSPTDTAHWYRFEAAQIGTNTITLPLVDGGQGDDDGTQNGVITDPGGPAVPGGSVDGVPTLSEWGALFLTGGLAALGALGLRQRRRQVPAGR
ncbi:beta strand repeat-containing protein [Curvibacter gracilis]|uniref:beta strand repeat-containing protein n=1 Tax=Curvibacter gracilis TaxID=230310 RepID=UPI00048049D9|nr:choice-of-anchor U domain-containing protein [Curvibacter gracilis]